jgi:hypothetical protein
MDVGDENNDSQLQREIGWRCDWLALTDYQLIPSTKNAKLIINFEWMIGCHFAFFPYLLKSLHPHHMLIARIAFRIIQAIKLS